MRHSLAIRGIDYCIIASWLQTRIRDVSRVQRLLYFVYIVIEKYYGISFSQKKKKD